MAEYTDQGQPPEGAEDGIGAAASSAYMEALEGGATPQEAFDAAAGAAQEVATEMGMPQDEFDAGLDAASQAFGEAMDAVQGLVKHLDLQWKLLMRLQILKLTWDLLRKPHQVVICQVVVVTWLA